MNYYLQAEFNYWLKFKSFSPHYGHSGHHMLSVLLGAFAMITSRASTMTVWCAVNDVTCDPYSCILGCDMWMTSGEFGGCIC